MTHRVERRQTGMVVVALEGDVDLQSSPEARRVLLDAVAHGGAVVVDLSKVGYIDSSGIASLVEALQKARQGGSRLVLAAVSDAAMRVLQLARLDRVFVIHPSLEAAITGDR
ncbi:MAG: anti-sigma factor antagonist [Rhodospirillales bacterium]|nr:MAG: anti-sigma factor antagonist [Rhodospirillales bacterium]